MASVTKTILIGGDFTVKFELPNLRGAQAGRAGARRATLLHDHVTAWSTTSAHAVDMARSDLQLALDERDSASFWLKATSETMRALQTEGAALHI